MAFLKKIWKKRRCEYPNRRRLTPVPGKQNEVDVARAEGIILEDGDQLSAENMNNLEERIQAGFDESRIYKATFLLDGWQQSGNAWIQTVSCPGMKTAYNAENPWFYKTGNTKTDAELQAGMNSICAGNVETLEGAIKVTVPNKPTCDVPVYLRRVEMN